MQDSTFPGVAALAGGLICAAALVVYAGLGWSLSRPETQSIAGLPPATQMQARQLHSSVRWAPWNSSNYTRLGMFYLANSRPAPAIEWLHRAAVWNSRSWQAWYYLGLAERAASHPARAEAAFRKVLSLNPDYIAVRRQFAGMMLDQGQFDDAANAYTALLRTGADQTRVQLGLGTALFRLGTYPPAERTLTQALARFSAYGEAHATLAATLHAAGDEQRAAREARLARNWRGMVPLRTDDPLTEEMETSFPTPLSLMQSAVRNRDPRSSVETMEKALALDPGMAIGWENIVGMYGQAHRPKDAERAWNNLAKIDPNNVRGRFDLAVVLTQSGDYARAAVLLNQALQLDPSYADIHRVLGLVAELAGNKDEAVTQFRTAFANDPTLSEAHVDLGLFLLKSGQAKEAQEELLRALLPPGESPERTLTRELAALKDPAVELAYEQVVRAQAEQRNQLSLITLLNNRKKPAAAKPIGLSGITLPASRQ